MLKNIVGIRRAVPLLVLSVISSPEAHALVLANTASIPVEYEVLKFDTPTTPEPDDCFDNNESFYSLLPGQIKQFHESRAPYIAICYRYNAHLQLLPHIIGNIQNVADCVIDLYTSPSPACNAEE